MNLKIFDWIMAIIVIAGLAVIPFTKYGWIIYSLGTLGYVYISYRKELYGYLTLNFVAIIIALNNFFRFI